MDATPDQQARHGNDELAEMSATGASITLESLRKQYPDGTIAVDSLSLQVGAGEVVVLIGPSGCGKSTVLRMVNRLVEPTAGRVLLDGRDVATIDPVALRRRIGYVIQHVGLFPHQTVQSNVSTVPRLLRWPRQRIAERTTELLVLVGLDPIRFARRYPHELSGGQRQRVGVARALAADPVVLLMDEPFSAVDPIARARLQEEFLRLREQVRTTTILVTHDLDEAIRLADRVAVLSDHARLEQYATPAALLASPRNPFVAEFVGTDRGIKRLSVTPIPRDRIRPLSTLNEVTGEPGEVAGDGGWPEVTIAGTLHDALAAMLRHGAAGVVVRDGGRTLGVLTPDDVRAALADQAATNPPTE